LQNQFDREGIIFSYSGAISYNLLTRISSAIREDFLNLKEDSKELFNIYTVFVEILQNIMNYSVDRISINEKSIGKGICVIKYDIFNQQYSVSSGNFILKENEEAIKEKIDKLNSLNKNELREYFKEARKSGKDAHTKGAGLGLIEIKRKTTGNLEYKISEIDNNLSYFELKANI
jgi:hypothetical protein